MSAAANKPLLRFHHKNVKTSHPSGKKSAKKKSVLQEHLRDILSQE